MFCKDVVVSGEGRADGHGDEHLACMKEADRRVVAGLCTMCSEPLGDELPKQCHAECKKEGRYEWYWHGYVQRVQQIHWLLQAVPHVRQGGFVPDMHTALPVLPESRPWRQNSGRVGLDADVRGKMVPEFAVRGPGLQAPWDSRQVDGGDEGACRPENDGAGRQD